jgi:hypothetical protein
MRWVVALLGAILAALALILWRIASPGSWDAVWATAPAWQVFLAGLAVYGIGMHVAYWTTMLFEARPDPSPVPPTEAEDDELGEDEDDDNWDDDEGEYDEGWGDEDEEGWGDEEEEDDDYDDEDRAR